MVTRISKGKDGWYLIHDNGKKGGPFVSLDGAYQVYRLAQDEREAVGEEPQPASARDALRAALALCNRWLSDDEETDVHPDEIEEVRNVIRAALAQKED